MEPNDPLINTEMATNSLALLTTPHNDIAQSTVHIVLHLLLSLKRGRTGIYMRLSYFKNRDRSEACMERQNTAFHTNLSHRAIMGEF
jgi:hypothetical protein